MTFDMAKAEGVYTISHWKPGVVGAHMAHGLSYPDAKSLARMEGALYRIDHVKNIVVSDGLNVIAQRLSGLSSMGAVSWHAIGTGTTAPALTDQALANEVTRMALASVYGAASVFNASVFYWAFESMYNIKELGLFAGSPSSTPGSGILFSRTLYTYNNTSGLVDLSFDYALTLVNA
jgi:hypothetical protein